MPPLTPHPTPRESSSLTLNSLAFSLIAMISMGSGITSSHRKESARNFLTTPKWREIFNAMCHRGVGRGAIHGGVQAASRFSATIWVPRRVRAGQMIQMAEGPCPHESSQVFQRSSTSGQHQYEGQNMRYCSITLLAARLGHFLFQPAVITYPPWGRFEKLPICSKIYGVS